MFSSSFLEVVCGVGGVQTVKKLVLIFSVSSAPQRGRCWIQMKNCHHFECDVMCDLFLRPWETSRPFAVSWAHVRDYEDTPFC